jgi:hypothetical protein
MKITPDWKDEDGLSPLCSIPETQDEAEVPIVISLGGTLWVLGGCFDNAREQWTGGRKNEKRIVTI